DLPRRPARPAAAELLPSTLRVLVVDDNAVNRQIVLTQLSRFGIRAEAEESGVEALALLRSSVQFGWPYDVALLDWQMRGMDALTLSRQSRWDGVLRVLPLIMVASSAPTAGEGAWKESNLAMTLTKPVLDTHLNRSLLRVLNLDAVPMVPRMEVAEAPARP